MSSLCCFRSSNDDPQSPHPKSPCTWIKSTAHELEIRDRCMGLMGRKGKNRKRHNSADFRYDPASYLLNFEDDKFNNKGCPKEEELPLYNFSARLPATPEREVAGSWN